MSQQHSSEDPLVLAKQAERDLNSSDAKTGHQKSDTALESGVDAAAANKFPGSEVKYGSTAPVGSEIPPEQGGGQQKGTGKMTKVGDFDQGEAGEGPEDVARRRQEERPGDDDVQIYVK